MEQTEYISQLPQETKSVASLFAPYPKPKKVRNLGPRQQLVNKVCFELGIAEHYRSGIYFQTKDFTDKELIDIKEEALKWKTNSAALFRKLVCQKRLAIKESLKNES